MLAIVSLWRKFLTLWSCFTGQYNPVGPKDSQSLTLCLNSTKVVETLEDVVVKSRAMYDAGAYLHWFWKHGCSKVTVFSHMFSFEENWITRRSGKRETSYMYLKSEEQSVKLRKVLCVIVARRRSWSVFCFKLVWSIRTIMKFEMTCTLSMPFEVNTRYLSFLLSQRSVIRPWTPGASSQAMFPPHSS